MFNSKEIDCPCQNVIFNDSNKYKRVLAFSKLRDECPALKQVIYPDINFEKFRRKVLTGEQCNSLFFDRFISNLCEPCRLRRLTTPIHKYILEGDRIREGSNQNYLKDLQENRTINIKAKDKTKAHEQYRIYMGKMYELIFADFLESEGYEIIDLEAWNMGAPDIYASLKRDDNYAFEIKGVFQETHNAINTISFYRHDSDKIDYLLGRTIEAADQLCINQKYGGKKVAVVISDNIDRDIIERELFDPLKPKFHNKENVIKAFRGGTETKNKKMEKLFDNPEEYIRQIDAVWLCGMSYSSSLKPEIIRKYEIRKDNQ